MQVRRAEAADAGAVSRVLEDLVAAGKRRKRADAEFALTHYILHPDQILCSLALDDAGEVLGFQSLKLAHAGNPYGTPVGWGMIGTHVRPSAARQGVGARLFAATRAAGLQAGLLQIEACIGAQNADGLRYYAALGFRTYREIEGAVCKAFPLGAVSV